MRTSPLPVSLPAYQLEGWVGRLPPTTEVQLSHLLTSSNPGQSASLPPGLGAPCLVVRSGQIVSRSRRFFSPWLAGNGMLPEETADPDADALARTETV